MENIRLPEEINYDRFQRGIVLAVCLATPIWAAFFYAITLI